MGLQILTYKLLTAIMQPVFMNVEEISEIGIEALREAKRVHDLLGKEAKSTVCKNQFGEQALRADLETEGVVIDVLRRRRLPVRVKSEEHGVMDLADEPVYLSVLDGIDGTGELIKGYGVRRYGTMLEICSSVHPRYGDYLFSGIMEHSSNRLWMASLGGGATVVDGYGYQVSMVSSDRVVYDDGCVVFVDTNHEFSRQYFNQLLGRSNTFEINSYAVAYADLAAGAIDLIAGVTKKGNLEQMISFGLLREVGADTMTLDGRSLEDRYYFEFGQVDNIPFVSVANKALGRDFLSKFGLYEKN